MHNACTHTHTPTGTVAELKRMHSDYDAQLDAEKRHLQKVRNCHLHHPQCTYDLHVRNLKPAYVRTYVHTYTYTHMYNSTDIRIHTYVHAITNLNDA